ncbi:transcriptional repressor NrdR [Streptohalobacillus salinus]|uniref:Transcriptional repressor NrdR n=1 Tax=Streptohalobacillus salinus TaxID=621096 RepID=A0A2V3WCY6_9BACI|nr:transcriptional regulator NrdR [Streptohalobacillus salinus]PXW90085.1 transcriptional repressor NrdR [Streptohalobacillus salinus]
MKCPNCQDKHTRVLDSRPIEDNQAIRRRRECENCAHRFTTFERVEEMPLIVVKKEGVRETFSRDKLIRGLMKSCEKRPVSHDQLESLALDVERTLRNRGVAEVESKDVGELVMDGLAAIDEVAYVRFASVYRQFKDINVFLDELKDIIHQTDANKNEPK